MRRLFSISLCFILLGAVPAFAAPAGEGKLGSAALFKQASPGVVLLIGKDSIGSGSILNSREILTNWHVIENNPRILVAFKPQVEGAALNPDEFVVGDVIKTSTSKDLALVRVKRIPSHVRPIPLGSRDEIEIGADVHAIGHPQGEIWTYTKGVISQIRNEFQWQAMGNRKFKADVIQTQTPINPGNSGGPLLSDRGTLVGVNSFKTRGGEGLNFAVALSEISRFVGQSGSRAPSKPAAPERTVPQPKAPDVEKENTRPTLVYQGRDVDNEGYLRQFASQKTKGETGIYFYPDDKARPFYFFRVRKNDMPDTIVMDLDRDGKWDYSVHDKDGNGKFDSIGLHPDGKMTPSSFVGFSDKKAPAEAKKALPKRMPEAGTQSVGSPSFDCRRADSLVEHTICGNDTLADLDVTVAALYSRVMEKRPNTRDQITKGQEEWAQGTRNQCREGDVASCVEGRYKQRVIYLNVLMLQ